VLRGYRWGVCRRDWGRYRGSGCHKGRDDAAWATVTERHHGAAGAKRHPDRAKDDPGHEEQKRQPA